jgi:peptidoglycan/LPS O-acetylase OafA/YrhL
LCYEVWFYALFAAATFLEGWKRAACVALLTAFAGPNILLMLPVWLVGVALARVPAARQVPAWLAPALVAGAVGALYYAPLLARTARTALDRLVPWDPGFATYAFSDLGLALCIALGFAGLRTLTLHRGAWLERIDAPVRWFANMSFSLYLLHWPLLKLTRVLRAPDQGAAGFAIVLIGIVALCGAFAAVTEHRRHAVRTLLERVMGGRRAAPAAI